MPDFQFEPGAHWIWTSQTTPPRNSFVCFRRSFEVAGAVESALLHLTADARYELFINGEWIGNGPPRSWPTPWPVDEYHLKGLLRSGKNTIAVLVHDFGISTFQYIKSDPGILAQFQWSDVQGENSLYSDGSWRATVNPAFEWSTPRINVQSGWEEQFDARLEPRDEQGHSWRDAEFHDTSWARALMTRPAGEAPHESFELRDIPFLTREIIEPVRLVKLETVQPAPLSTSFNLRHALNAEDETANYFHGCMLAVTHLISGDDQQIELHFPIGLQGFEWKLNGDSLPQDGEHLQLTDHAVRQVKLNKGVNTLMARPLQTAHSWRASLNIWPDTPLRLQANPAQDTRSVWLAVGPFGDAPSPASIGGLVQSGYVAADFVHPEATGEVWENIWNRGTLAADELNAAYVRALEAGDEFELDVFAVCASERTVAVPPQIDEPHALMHDSSNWTTIHPNAEGDTRMLLDFGDELVGFWELEVDAPEGTILDWQGFEFIQRDGKVNLCDLMNNSLRYICREGTQHYRSFTRRGFRYCFLSVREHSRPVRIRYVRAIFNTYPTTQDGDFACSDALLQRIWHVGAQSVRACAEDAYTDCPAYEQVFWVGDARNEAIVDLVANGDPRLSAHCWTLAARSLNRMSLVEATAPSGRPLILPAWTFLWMRWAHEHFWLTGDRTFAEQALPFLERNNAGIEAHLNDRDLFEIVAWNMFDWAPMDTPFDGIVTHQNCLAVLGLRQSAQLARSLNNAELATRWDSLGDRIAHAVNRHMWSEEHGAYVDCIRADGSLSPVVSQQTHTAAYISGVADAPFGTTESAERCRSIIDEAPDGFVTAGSPFFMFFALEAWERQGRYAILVDAIRDYWGPQIEAGATTFWEMYHPHKPRLTRSHCHGWSAAPTFFLTQQVLGITPLEPGYARVCVAPRPEGVTWAQGRVPTPRGPIEIYWKQDEDRAFSLRLELPPDTPTRLELPCSGAVQVEKGNVSTVENGNGLLVLETTSTNLKLRVCPVNIGH